MNFVGYTYKADVEAEKSMLVNVLKELDSVSEQQYDENQPDNEQIRHGGNTIDSSNELSYAQNQMDTSLQQNQVNYSQQQMQQSHGHQNN
mmetsp:Transcript_12286/g.20669  ORF Transcript_12286/g.20669 Transcript_12286/m.20669 type:complete len:90 (-) Transcript_12286:715-984(-)